MRAGTARREGRTRRNVGLSVFVLYRRNLRTLRLSRIARIIKSRP